MAIYIHDEAARLRLRVTGDLDELAAKELASCWTTASSVLGSRKIVVDLTSLAEACESGRHLLGALHKEGVEFLTKSEYQTELVRGVAAWAVGSRALLA